jgi:undecaprenyl diphosphate synthase
MDGNGRWANQRNRPRLFGHIRGSAQVRPIVRECGRLGVKYLTLYTFSEENWRRPSQEISVLMRLLEKYLQRERKTLMENSVRLQAIGDLNKLPGTARRILEETIKLTEKNTGLTLIFALSYGAQQEIVAAVQKIAEAVKAGQLQPSEISTETIQKNLFTAEIPDPDLVIRTSGEHRISNFLLWQSAYSEFYFTPKLWPEFDVKELHKALESFSNRERRYGAASQGGATGTVLYPEEGAEETSNPSTEVLQ